MVYVKKFLYNKKNGWAKKICYKNGKIKIKKRDHKQRQRPKERPGYGISNNPIKLMNWWNNQIILLYLILINRTYYIIYMF